MLSYACITESKIELISILMFCSFYRKFVKDFAQKIALIHALTIDPTKFLRSKEAEKSVQTLEAVLATPPVLAFPNPEKEFIVFVDASRVAVGTSLMQKQDNSKFHPVQYASRSL